MKKRIVTLKNEEPILFDLSLWTKIKAYVSEHYTLYNIKITHMYREDEFADFDSAYNYIQEYADDITNINIHAQSDNESFNISFKNYHERKLKDRYTISFKAQCPNSDRANDVRLMMINIIAKNSISTSLLIGLVFFGSAFMQTVMRDMVILNNPSQLLNIVIRLSVFPLAYIIYIVVNRLFMGRKKIYFCTDDKQAGRFKAMKLRYYVFVTALAILLTSLVAANIFIF